MYKLRELERKDIEKINLWRNSKDLIDMLGAPFRYINSEVDYKWYDSYMVNRDKMIRCAIVDSNDDILGLVSLVTIDYMNQSAELHIMIGEKKNRGCGIGTFAVIEILKHAFFDMNINRIELAVLEQNTHAIRLYEKIGFTYEGTKRKAKYKNGIFENIKIYAILRNEFEEKWR